MRSLILIPFLFCLACNNSTKQSAIVEDVTVSTEDISEDESILSNEKSEEVKTILISKGPLIDSLLILADSSNKHFHFAQEDFRKRSIDIFSGYFDYNEDQYGFQNPAYLKIFVDNKIFLEDFFEAYEDMWVKSLGQIAFTDTLEFFKLNYGLEASDYIVVERLLFISDSTCQVIDEFSFQGTSYASGYTEYLFPTDSGGMNNSLLTIDKIDYHTEEEPNIRDTTIYDYRDNKFIKRGS